MVESVKQGFQFATIRLEIIVKNCSRVGSLLQGSLPFHLLLHLFVAGLDAVAAAAV